MVPWETIDRGARRAGPVTARRAAGLALALAGVLATGAMFLMAGLQGDEEKPLRKSTRVDVDGQQARVEALPSGAVDLEKIEGVTGAGADSVSARAVGDCLCGQDTEGFNDFCFEDQFCTLVTRCTSSSQCGGGQRCLANNCCGFSACFNECTQGCAAGGVCGSYRECDILKCAPPGDDCFGTACDGTTQYDFNLSPTPLNYFGPGSLPFSGVVSLGGPAPGSIDTVIRRLGPMCFSEPLPDTQQVPIEIVSLSLKSCSPITVSFTSPPHTEQWDIYISLPPGQQPGGLIDATKTHPNGGVYSAFLPVNAQYAAALNPSVGPTTIPQPAAPTSLTTVAPAPWLQLGGAGCGVTTGFFPGSDEDDLGQLCCKPTCHAGPAPGHDHCTYPPDCPPCPPDPIPPPCPLPPAPIVPWCANLQDTDCLISSSGDVCLPKVVTYTSAGSVSVEQCECFEPSGCGPVDINGDVLSCPPGCPVPGEICQIHTFDGVITRNTRKTSVGPGDVPPGVQITCECAPPPPPDRHATWPVSPPLDPTRVIFGTGDTPAIPADFFAPGSEPFTGTVVLQGEPDAIDPGGETSVVLQRRSDPVTPWAPPGALGTVDIEIVELRLVSIDPIPVPVGTDTSFWDVHVRLSPAQADQAPGQITAHKTHANGGTYDSMLVVQPLFVFINRDTLEEKQLDTANPPAPMMPLPPLILQSVGDPFVHVLNPNLDVDVDADATWVPGVVEVTPGDLSSQQPSLVDEQSDDSIPPSVIHWVCLPRKKVCLYEVKCVDGTDCSGCPLVEGGFCRGTTCPNDTCTVMNGQTTICGPAGSDCCVEFGLFNCRVPAGEPFCPPLGQDCVCEPDTGACCLPDGTCVDGVPQSACPAAGTWLAGQTCGPVVACCFPSGVCQEMNEACCLAAMGTPSGAACGDIGACCDPVTGDCSMEFEACCAGTWYTGDCLPTQACCLPNGQCLDLDPRCCQDMGGSPQGPACANADNVPPGGNGVDDACEPPALVCPLPPDKLCAARQATDCPTTDPATNDTCRPRVMQLVDDGTGTLVPVAVECDCFEGECGQVEYLPGFGVRCPGVCPVDPADICEVIIDGVGTGQTFVSNGDPRLHDGADIICDCLPDDLGSCCDGNGNCTVTTQANCPVPPNLSWTTGGTCTPTGACCVDTTGDGLPDTCQVMAQDCCAALPNSSFVAGGDCLNVGACCVDDNADGTFDRCQIMPEDCCAGVPGGSFAGAGTTCPDACQQADLCDLPANDFLCAPRQTTDCVTSGPAGELCLPLAVSKVMGVLQADQCDCLIPGDCGPIRAEMDAVGVNLVCEGPCPVPPNNAGDFCQVAYNGQAQGFTSVRDVDVPEGVQVTCDCAGEPQQDCGANSTQTDCVGLCTDTAQVCEPKCVNYDPLTGAIAVTDADCNCINPDDCHVDLIGTGARIVGNPCVIPENPPASGTVTLPPIGCDYLSPDEVHMIINGLPATVQIELAPIHREFICNQPGGTARLPGCPPAGLCEDDGGTFPGGKIDCFESELHMTLQGKGPSPWDTYMRTFSIPVSCQVHTGPRTPGDPVQDFDTKMHMLTGQINGDPDFDLLKITGGNGFGLPSPGHTTLTRLPGGNYAVDSFFDITYEIEFVGTPGSVFAGMSGSTTGTIRMETGQKPACKGTCPPGKMCRQKVTDNPIQGGVDICCDCVPKKPVVVKYPHNRKKGRYVSFGTDSDGTRLVGPNVAYKIRLKSIEQGSCSGNGGACREDKGMADCNECSIAGNPCIPPAAINCTQMPPQTCDPTGETCINDLPGSVGMTWWVGCESPLGNGVHLLVSEPFRKVSNAWPAEVHAGDCEVVPNAVYGVRAVDVDTLDESDELEVDTTERPVLGSNDARWGDGVRALRDYCTGNWAPCGADYGACIAGVCDPGNTSIPDTAICVLGQCVDAPCPIGEACIQQWGLPDRVMNFDEITAMVFKFQSLPGKTVPDVRWVDLHGDDGGDANVDPPNFVINFSDIGFAVFAFQGRPYPWSDPADCPDVSSWPNSDWCGDGTCAPTGTCP